MKVIDIRHIIDESFLYGMNTVDGIDFLNRKEINYVYEACNSDSNNIKYMFDTIGIKYDSINFKPIITYEINGMELMLNDLSSGERYLLYLLSGKIKEDKITAIGLFERLGDRLLDVAIEQLVNYQNLIIVYYKWCPRKLRHYEINCKDGDVL